MPLCLTHLVRYIAAYCGFIVDFGATLISLLDSLLLNLFLLKNSHSENCLLPPALDFYCCEASQDLLALHCSPEVVAAVLKTTLRCHLNIRVLIFLCRLRGLDFVNFFAECRRSISLCREVVFDVIVTKGADSFDLSLEIRPLRVQVRLSASVSAQMHLRLLLVRRTAHVL